MCKIKLDVGSGASCAELADTKGIIQGGAQVSGEAKVSALMNKRV